jgi:hypothetical protein
MNEKYDLREELRRLRYQRPFRPFRIVTSDGQRYKIAAPFSFAFSTDRIVVLARPGPLRTLKFGDVEGLEQLKRKP